MDKHYSYRILWLSDDEEYAGVCDGFPLLSYVSKRPETALEGIIALIKDITLHEDAWSTEE